MDSSFNFDRLTRSGDGFPSIIHWGSSLLRHLWSIGWSKSALCLLLFLASIILSYCIYQWYFHPLAKYPGPRFAALSKLYMIKVNTSGQVHITNSKLHERYGDVVRVGPDELSFATTAAWKDIYGPTSKTRRTFIKSKVYKVPGLPPNLIAMRDPAEHAARRREFAMAFSARGMRTQAHVIMDLVDLWIERLSQHAQAHSVNFVEWYSWLSFDIIGDLTFGEPFGAVAAARDSEMTRLNNHVFYVGVVRNLLDLTPWLRPFRRLVLSPQDDAMWERQHELLHDNVRKRMDKKSDRQDFFQDILARQENPWTEAQLQSESHGIISAGSDTITSTMTFWTYNLLRNPHVLAALTHEIRTAFAASSEITIDRANQLVYLSAALDESLRLATPVAFGLPRESPGSLVDGHAVPPGAVVHVSGWTLAHSERYWTDPHAYRPERWLESQASVGNPMNRTFFTRDNREAFRPFSGGPRGCIGVNLAYMEMRVTMAKLLWHYDLTLDMSVDRNWLQKCSFRVQWHKPPLKIRLKRVDGAITQPASLAYL